MTGVLVARADPPFVVTYADSAALRTLGREREATVGHELLAVLGVHELDSMLDAAIAGEEACHVRMPRPAVAGAPRERCLTLAPLPLQSVSRHTLVTVDDAVIGTEARTDVDDSSAIIDLVSHELRSPLNSALTWTSLLDIDRTQKTVDRAVAVIRQSIQEQTQLIDDLVEVGRARHPRQLDAEPFDFGALTEEAVQIARAKLPQHTTLTYSPPARPCTIVGDPARLRRAVRHIVDNATKFMPGGGTIDAELRATSGSVLLEVRDQGIGLSADEVSRTFTPFWRAQPKLRGGGLGLGVIHTVVSRHDGIVSARSAGPNRGAAFTITLPLQRNE